MTIAAVIHHGGFFGRWNFLTFSIIASLIYNDMMRFEPFFEQSLG